MLWDSHAWLAYLLRYHALSLVAAALALSMLRLGHSGHSTAVLVFIAHSAAAGTLWPDAAIAAAGVAPWLPLSALETAVLLLVGSALLAAFTTAVQLLLCALGAVLALLRLNCQQQPWLPPALAAAVLGSTAVHPALPGLTGGMVLAWRLAATPQQQHSLAFAWLVTDMLSSLPGAALLIGWLAAGRSYGYPWMSVHRWVLALAGGHACSIAWRLNALAAGKCMLQGPGKAAPTLAAAIAAVYGLWGHLHGAMYAASALQMWDLALAAWRSGF